jgi:hypothetical protein
MRLDGAQDPVGWYGYINDAPSPDDATLPQMIGTPASPHEAQKTEPDKNTYLVLQKQTGADPNYDYGTHFLFQGHEVPGVVNVNGAKGSYITRINLDADIAHRVTLLATTDSDGHPIAGIDGSTWDPWAKRLLFTTENSSAPTYAATAGYPSTVADVSGALGRGGYEGTQDDSEGNIWIVEDIGGSGKQGTTAKQPNSFVYRYVPKKPGDLAHGKLQVLQVWDNGRAVTFASQAAINAPNQVDLRTYGKKFQMKWVTIHDTLSTGTRRSTRIRSRKRPTVRRSSGQRTASSAQARISPSSSSTKPVTRTQRVPRTGPPAGGRRSSSSTRRTRPQTAGSCRSSTSRSRRP